MRTYIRTFRIQTQLHNDNPPTDMLGGGRKLEEPKETHRDTGKLDAHSNLSGDSAGDPGDARATVPLFGHSLLVN